jgi:NAD(P)-dependent dehydrogenase (short-subunit alcohol dehydrogenase family)
MPDDQEQLQPPQRQTQPGIEQEMTPEPDPGPQHQGSGKLAGKVALITGGDSGIGRAVAVLFAREGAEVAIGHLAEEATDANQTVKLVQAEGRRCLTLPGDVGNEAFCQEAVARTVGELGRLDVLVNNAAEQHTTQSIAEISAEQLERTFRTNIFAMFFLTKAALPHLGEGSAIVNTTSVTAYQGNPSLVDYSSTKGAIVAFTRSLSQQLVGKGIRVNAVAPGPIWTPLIPATMPAEQVAAFGKDVPMGRPGQPEEVAPCYLFLASDDASYMAGQVLHPNGGNVVNG